MLITINKRGSINLPAILQKELGLNTGAYLDLSVEEGGAIKLHPVSIFPSIRLNDQGLEKLRKAPVILLRFLLHDDLYRFTR
ncbi:MAG: hypothetical protein MUO68_21940 [Desulfobacteraceae bacterium]|nr:hypothetical protein [Desulfobacteraceae bacterium]